MVSAPNDAGPKKRLVIKKMVLENFKSYAGAQHVGPFHKVRHVVVVGVAVDVACGVAGRVDARRETQKPIGTARLDPDTIPDAPTRVSARGRPAPRSATRLVVVPPRRTSFFSSHPPFQSRPHPPFPAPSAVFLLRGWS